MLSEKLHIVCWRFLAKKPRCKSSRKRPKQIGNWVLLSGNTPPVFSCLLPFSSLLTIDGAWLVSIPLTACHSFFIHCSVGRVDFLYLPWLFITAGWQTCLSPLLPASGLLIMERRCLQVTREPSCSRAGTHWLFTFNNTYSLFVQTSAVCVTLMSQMKQEYVNNILTVRIRLSVQLKVLLSFCLIRCDIHQDVKVSWESLWTTCVRSSLRTRRWKTT